jgi:hypothetical protein
VNSPQPALPPAPSLRPFLWAALAWGMISMPLAFALGGDRPGSAMAWAAGIWALCALDLLALCEVLRRFLGLSRVSAERRSAHLFQTLFWAGAKVACLGSFAAVLMKADDAPSAGILLGTATLVVVPLAGGFWWSQRELKNAS